MSKINSRIKGKCGEREIVNLARGWGLPACRTWETAQHQDKAVRGCDVEIAGKKYQVKRVRKLPKNLFAEISAPDRLISGTLVREDGGEWLVILSMDATLLARL